MTTSAQSGTLDSMVALILVATGWLSATQVVTLEGDAAFSYHIESAAEVNGYSLDNPGCALMSCGDKWRDVWVLVNGDWTGPLTSVDCSQEVHYQMNLDRGRVIDLPWSLWQELDLPLDLVPVTVSFRNPHLVPVRRHRPV